MKRISFFVALLAALVLSFGLANAQTAISISGVDGLWTGHPDTIKVGTPIKFKLSYSNGTAFNLAISNGYEIYSPTGAVWDTLFGEVTGALPSSNFDLSFAINTFDFGDAEPVEADTIGIIGAKISGVGIPAGFNGQPYNINIGAFTAADAGKTICIDSAFFRPGGAWKWVGSGAAGSHFPTWTGEKCYTIFLVPNEPPEISNEPPSISGSHCSVLTFDFDAVDPTLPIDGGPDAITYNLVSGPGSINATTGVWTWNTATLADVGASLNIVVEACDLGGSGGCGQQVNVAINVTNAGPAISNCPVGAFQVSEGNGLTVDLNATDDCDPLTWSILGIANNGGADVANVDANGVVDFTAGTLGNPRTVVVTVQVTDGLEPTTCDITINIIEGSPYKLKIAKTHNVLQGLYHTVPVLIEKIGSAGLGGFDLLIAYDNSVLSFKDATLSAELTACGWEYFTYRTGANGNCSGGCPSGLIRLIGLAETNNGPNHPDNACISAEAGDTLVNLNFLVSNNYTVNCMYAPIRFFWLDCGDNTLSNIAGDTLYISATVAEYENELIFVNNENVGFPTYLGAQAACEVGLQGKPAPIRSIDFVNGGVDIVCADSIDARGDVNLNNQSYEIADAVMFTRYFLIGTAAFTVSVPGSIAATDVNADGLTLSVADLVYLIRVIVGDAAAVPKTAPSAIEYTAIDGVLAVNSTAGGAFVVVKGNVTPELLANNMEMVSAFDGVNTRILVYPSWTPSVSLPSFAGSFLNVGNAELVSIELATTDGRVAAAKNGALPTAFALNQNYPNPFNPGTTISLALPQASNYTLTIYNVTGQKVKEISGTSEAGLVEVQVDMSNNASGVYFYKVVAGNFSDTKKMVLLK